MFDKKHEQTLQELVCTLDDKTLEAVVAFIAHIDEELHIHEERHEADYQLEANREYRQPLKAGFYYGEAVGSKKAGNFAVSSLSRLLALPLQKDAR